MIGRVLRDAGHLARFLAGGVPLHAIGSIDVTERCNLRCRHCYFFSPAVEREGDLDVERWRERFERLRLEGFPFYGVTWVGGEPLLRKELIELGMGYFRFNKVVTNGTIALPTWDRVSFVISVDGTEAAHDRQRGGKTYGRIREHVREAGGRLNVALHCCLTALNVETIEALVDEWRAEPVRGIVFDFYTPVAGLDDDALWMGWEAREAAIDRLLALKRRHPRFVKVPRSVLRAMRRANMGRFVGSPERCAFARKAFAWGTQGGTKRPCMLGEKADCTRCGCIVPYAMGQIERLDRETVGFLFRGGF